MIQMPCRYNFVFLAASRLNLKVIYHLTQIVPMQQKRHYTMRVFLFKVSNESTMVMELTSLFCLSCKFDKSVN